MTAEKYKFDAHKKIAAMRLKPEELREMYYAMMELVTPQEEAFPPQIIPATDTVEEAEELKARNGELIGLSTGYVTIDAMTEGLGKGDLIIIYGDTSHGKSQLSQNITYNLAKGGHKVLFIGLEMINAQNTRRLLDIGGAELALEQALGNVLYPLVNDLGYDTIPGYIEEAVSQGVEMVVIDQLQQLTRDPGNVANETSMITHEIKRMAVKHQVPIILISHINRSGQKSGAPTLSELKGSSSIEQDADICIAVWRDTNPRNDAMDVMEVWMRKNRNRGHVGETATLMVKNGVKLVEPNLAPTKLL